MNNIKTKYRKIEGADEGAIRILDEKYKNVAVSIGKIRIDDSSKDDKATLKYDYDVLEVPENIELDEDFDNLLGDIIVDILESKLESDPESLRFNE
tara:strand:+ start:468 stop:755 length:288 start_codon:yes stop_codon:yes gene_type:complete